MPYINNFWWMILNIDLYHSRMVFDEKHLNVAPSIMYASIRTVNDYLQRLSEQLLKAIS
jgi:hypothetical protein